MPEVVHRQAVRATIFDAQGRILLMQAQDPASKRRVWFTPGGGVASGESLIEALHRELLEETGQDSFDVGPAVWTRRHLFDWDGRVIDQSETYYLVQSDRFEPTMSDTEPDELSQFQQFRWWSAEEIEDSEDLFAPRRLPELMRQLLADGPPATLLDTGV